MNKLYRYGNIFIFEYTKLLKINLFENQEIVFFNAVFFLSRYILIEEKKVCFKKNAIVLLLNL